MMRDKDNLDENTDKQQKRYPYRRYDRSDWERMRREMQENWHRSGSFSPAKFKTKRRFLFGRFLGFLLFFALPLVLISGAFGALLSETVDASPRLHFAIVLFCGFPLVLALIIGAIGSVIFRSLGTPLADIMVAADAVAEGDLTTRVEEKGPREFRKMARSFNRMTEELEHADQQRRNLTADIAHELRTPIHILQGNLEGILDGVYEPTSEQIDSMLDETRMLSRLVDDLQTLSLAEAGQLHFKMEPIDIAELLADVGTSFSGPMEAAGIDFQVAVEGFADGLTITGDVERLDQVLSNLLGNALRHTPEGGQIRLRAATTPKEVQILVLDNGDGISPEDLPYIFDRFWRGDKSRQRKSGTGSGLGLAIAKQFVQAHGGEIQVESEPGRGTTFTVCLPRE